MLLSIGAYLLILAGAAILIDVQYYQNAKKDIIKYEYFREFSIFSREFRRHLQDFLTTEDEAERQELKKRLLEEAREILKSDFPLIRIQILKQQEPLLDVRREEIRPFHTFKNSLLFRNFSAVGFNKFEGLSPEEELLGELVFTYTNPIGFKPIEKLTLRYWAILLAVSFLITAVYFFMLFFLILPVKKVAEAIQRGGGENEPVRFVHHPRTHLEKLYNRLARSAILTDLTNPSRHSAGHNLRTTLPELFSWLAPRIRNWLGFEGAWILEMNWESREKLEMEFQIPTAPPPPEENWKRLAPVFEGSLLKHLRTSQESGANQLLSRNLANGNRLYLGVLPAVEPEPRLRLLVLEHKRQGINDSNGWWRETAELLYRHVVGLVEQQLVQSRELFREKSEANINLSRNLGHDLTNIIATNKLELMTIGQLTRGEVSSNLSAEQKESIIHDTMVRVLDNMRSLQEIVNLYRAYEYLKSPCYEKVNLVRIVEEILEIFRLSMSFAAQVELTRDDGDHLLEVEPRLLKLAIFNLLSNAQDAIRQLPDPEQSQAKIFVQLESAPDKKKGVCLRLRDTGPGIRNREGNPASREEIRRIFDLGYTTKPGGQGEGLGLNWVRSILTEFHEGDLRARNAPEGGAVFECRLYGPPSREK